jgi:hypothetical protein
MAKSSITEQSKIRPIWSPWLELSFSLSLSRSLLLSVIFLGGANLHFWERCQSNLHPRSEDKEIKAGHKKVLSKITAYHKKFCRK